MKTYWADGSAVWTNYADAISILFPAWERAFVAVAEHHLPNVKDSELRNRMVRFAAEELSHANAHEAYNNRRHLKEAELAEVAKTKVVHRKPGIKLWLGTMVSIEHLAACLSRGVLQKFSNCTGRDFQLFLWHSREEIGHKSLAIDLWRYLGYSDADLRKIARFNQSYVLKFLLGYTLKNVYKDGALTRLRTWKDLIVWAWFIFTTMLIPAMKIYLPNFHPDKVDDSKWLTA